jgi:hypothetical protein
MTDAHWSGPFRIAPGSAPAGANEYEPNYGLIAHHLAAVAEVVLATNRPTVSADTLLYHPTLMEDGPDLRDLQPAEVEHLLAVLEQAGLVGPIDQAGRRTILTFGRRPVKKVMEAVRAIAHVAGQLGDQPALSTVEELYR